MNKFYRNPHIYFPFLTTCMIFIIAFFVGYTGMIDIENKLVLHKDLQGDIDLTGQRGEIFFSVGIMFVFFIVNILLSKQAYKKEKVLSYILSYVNIWISLLALIYISSVLSIN